MRFLGIVLTLVFGLAMVGPETHACPIHDQSSSVAHHQHAGNQHQRTHCTCPQACCPAGVSVSLPMQVAHWTAAPRPLVAVSVEVVQLRILPARPRLLPFGLAPPLL